MNKVEKKREKEIQTVGEMIRLYCHKNHHTTNDELCDECKELLEYATYRSSVCPFMENKTFCSNCRVHCYKPNQREKIRKVMRFSGPRMLFHHPIMAIHHVISSNAEKRKMKKEEKRNG